MRVQYVVLSYAENVLVEHGQPIALVIKRLEADSDAALEFHARPNWRALVQDEDVDYVQSVFSELQDESYSQDPEMFDRLTEMSSGALRTGDSGACDDDDLKARMAFLSLSH